MPRCSYPGCTHGDPSFFNEKSESEGHCIFHATPECKGITPDEFNGIIYDLINRNYLNLEGAIFPKELNFRGFPFRTRLNLKNAIFYGHVDFSNQNFTHETIFEKCKFKAGANFNESTFNSTANFRESEYSGSVSNERFGDCCALFIGTNFGAKVDFLMAKFLGGNTLFKQAKFTGGYASFAKTIFEQGITSFELSAFTGGDAIFKESIFSCKIVDFSNSIFQNHITDFENANFNQCDVNFVKAKIHSLITKFSSGTFNGNSINFSEIESKGQSLDFFNAKFGATTVSFVKATFNAIETSFDNTEFKGLDLCFRESTFAGEKLSFFQTRIFSNIVSFKESTFDCIELAFNMTIILGQKLDFTKSNFNGKQIVFEEVNWGSSEVNFNSCNFNGETSFNSNGIRNILSFKDIRIKDGVFFFFSNPSFQTDEYSFPRVIFKNAKFNPFTTFFEQIGYRHWSKDINVINMPAIIFRQSYLKDVYFTKCNLSLFSFYQCAFFEEAMFISNHWDNEIESFQRSFFHDNRIRIWEEKIFEELKMADSPFSGSNAQIGGELVPSNYNELAELYMRFKASADKAKDYHHAGQYYYNEFEMKRMNIKQWIQLKRKTNEKGNDVHKDRLRRFLTKFRLMDRIRPLWSWIQFMIYTSYKYIAGYGESVWLPSLWLFLATIIFSFIYLFTGIKINGQEITYELSLRIPNIFIFIKHLFYAMLYSISRLIPTSQKIVDPNTLDALCKDSILSIFNWFVLAILLIFVGVSLKRHFRRF